MNINDPFFGISRYDALKQTESNGPTRITFVSGSDSSKKRSRALSIDKESGLDSICSLTNGLPTISSFGSDTIYTLNATLSSSIARERFTEANNLLEAFMNPGLSDPASTSIKRSRTESSEDELVDLIIDHSNYTTEYGEEGLTLEGADEDVDNEF